MSRVAPSSSEFPSASSSLNVYTFFAPVTVSESRSPANVALKLLLLDRVAVLFVAVPFLYSFTTTECASV